MDIVIDVIVGFLEKLIETVSKNVPPEQKIIVHLLIWIASLVFLIMTLLPIYNFFAKRVRGYIAARERHAMYRIEFPGAFSWGNSVLRAPLLLIGTDIYCFAQLSQKNKTIRYLKSAAVILPTLWCVFGLIVFISSSGIEAKALDVRIMAVPVIIIATTILVLDISILNGNGSIKSKITRGFFAIVTGYIFSSVPLNYYFKATIDSRIAEVDHQLTNVEKDITGKIKAITDAQWYGELAGRSKEIAKINSQKQELQRQLIESKVSNRQYQKIKKDLDDQLNLITDAIDKTGKLHDKDLDELNKLKQYKIDITMNLKKDNNSNQIKRHEALWGYALSSLATFVYFFAIMLLFWMVDSLALLMAALGESEYEALCAKHQAEVGKEFDRFTSSFLPLKVGNTPTP
jgi:Skp family chaperone for outer membrane proteins